jgi:hypothetical protein
MITTEMIFYASTSLSALGWLLLMLFPHKGITQNLVHKKPVLSLAISVMYLYCIAVYLWDAKGGFFSLADVRLLFEEDFLLLAGWIHYLALDLVIGAWMVRRAKERGIPHLTMIPVLVFAYALAPIGYILYFILKSFYPQKSIAEEVGLKSRQKSQVEKAQTF